ncbi:hypothetical protein [Croceicoccus hydrothermalis]|uniref:hypothetical protein n=1 Tax=Croceicoccus hydrothermalis TaxID=2867964 RepID=UPI001EFBF5FD|nr:hypothetical protein [Croceicoccus hydrothermalis]
MQNQANTELYPEPETKPTLSDRVSAAQDRIAESTAPARSRAGDAAVATKDFVSEHPFIAVAGALAVGAIIAVSLPGRPGRKVRGSVMAAGGTIAELAATYGAQLLEMAEDASNASQEKLEEIGDSIAEATSALTGSARIAGESAIDSASRAGERTADTLERAAHSTMREGRTLVSRLRR